MEAIWVFLAFVCGLAAQLCRIPVLVGYLVAGFILATFDVEHTRALHHLADLGLSLLLFSVGLHLRAKSFFRPEVLGSALIHLLLVTACFTLVLEWFTGEVLWQFACAFGFSSTVVTVSAFEKRQELGSFLGRLALGILVVQDIVSVILIAGDVGYQLSLHVLWLLLIVPAQYLLRLLLSRLHSRELFLLFGIGYAFVLDDLFSYVGLSGHLGALVAGASLASHPRSEKLSQELWSVKELLLLALFLSIGMYGLPPLSMVPLVIAMLSLLPLKTILFFGVFLLFRLRARTAFVASLSLTAYSEFTLVVAYYLQQNGGLAVEFLSATAVVTALSFGACSSLIFLSDTFWAKLQSRLLPLQWSTHPIDRSPPSFGKADLLIIGMGVTGVAAYERALSLGHRPVGIDSDPARVSERLQEEKRVIQADCQDGSFWAEVNLTKIRWIVLAIPSLRPKIAAIELIRKFHFKGQIFALARDSQSAQRLKDIGVQVSIVPMVEAGFELAEQLEAAST